MMTKMNVKVCYLLPLIALLGLVSCATQPNREQPPTALKLPKLSTESSDEQRLPVTPTAQAVDLSHFQAPQHLAGLKLDGEISTQRGRTLHYRSEDKKEQLSLTLSGLPAGWDNMPAPRAVASYYSEVRQRRVNQALQDSANALTILSETLLDLEGQPSAQAQMKGKADPEPVPAGNADRWCLHPHQQCQLPAESPLAAAAWQTGAGRVQGGAERQRQASSYKLQRG